MKRLGSLCLVIVFLASAASAEVSFIIPIVTQVQGQTFYRTSISAMNIGPPTAAALFFRYRSPVDNTFQEAEFFTASIPTSGVFAVDDVIDFLKTQGAIRAADMNVGLFGTLEVQFFQVSVNDPGNYSVVARTYSPGLNGVGTVGISYAGRANLREHGSIKGLATTVRNGAFGRDGNSRANIGLMSMGHEPTDIRIVYLDSVTRATLKTFLLSSAIGRLIAPYEVVQLSNVFLDPSLAGYSRVTVYATPTTGALINGYVVQLDNTTNDGSFYLMGER